MVPEVGPVALATAAPPTLYGDAAAQNPRRSPAEAPPARVAAADAAAQNAKAALERSGIAFPSNASLQIDRDQDTGRMVYKSIDRTTGDVLDQWPSEEVLARIKAFTPDAAGVAVDRRV